MMRNRFVISLSDKDDVGSSKMMMDGFWENTFTISTIC